LGPEEIKMVFVHDMQPGRFKRTAGGRTREFIQQDHLSKKIAGPELGHGFRHIRREVPAQNLDASFGHNKKCPAQMPLLKHDVARGVRLFHGSVDKASEVPPPQIFKEDDVPEKLYLLAVGGIPKNISKDARTRAPNLPTRLPGEGADSDSTRTAILFLRQRIFLFSALSNKSEEAVEKASPENGFPSHGPRNPQSHLAQGSGHVPHPSDLVSGANGRHFDGARGIPQLKQHHHQGHRTGQDRENDNR
jgi:hypothetical protein